MLENGEMKMVRELSYNELGNIISSFTLTEHAKQRLLERYGNNSKNTVKRLLKQSTLVYYNTDNSINVGVDEYSYMVFHKMNGKHKYICITFKEKSRNGYSVMDKFKLALLGIGR
jgi:histidyl-tRNA synthetase